ncbi:MAG: amidase family protein [Gemmatimonadota bacterium]
MPFLIRRLSVVLALVVLGPGLVSGLSAQRRPMWRVEEKSIADIHRAMRAGTLTCRALVAAYLERIAALDKTGPAINAIIVINPKALDTADSLDRRYRQAGPVGPLHCVPTIVKDNFETYDLPTTAGSLSLKGWVSNRDAYQVRKLREAGAIVLAKSNMAEYAFSPFETVSSILPGYTKNPYALDRVTAGSSGGTAAAVAASYGAVGLGTDTGNSIRGPSAHNALVGIRSTMGLTSRAGIVPLSLASDIAGPIARTLADAVAVFQVIVGEDSDDPVTVASRGREVPDYSASLVGGGLRGARIGVLRQAYETATTDSEVVTVFQRAIADMVRQGAEIVDPIAIDSLDAWRRGQTGSCFPFKYDLNRYLETRTPKPPVASLEEVIKSRQFHPSIEVRLTQTQAMDLAPEDNPACKSRDEFRAKLRGAVVEVMDRQRLDALVYPTWSNPPRLIGDLNTPGGDNNQLFSPSTGFPAITVPMGYTRGNRLPAGLQFFGRPWGEPGLIKLAYGYEQATRHRRPPKL